ncbi:MAG TPA: hypothetical protein VNI77_08295 [Nitrososphaera sp.]|nr:hypothetical protein [Nitrososphaera sp.]
MDLEKMNPEDFLSIVTDVYLLRWGSELQFACIDDPMNEQPYLLVFKNCREIKWTVLELDRVKDVEAELIGALPGKPNYQEPAIIHTDVFEVEILYEEFEIQKR